MTRVERFKRYKSNARNKFTKKKNKRNGKYIRIWCPDDANGCNRHRYRKRTSRRTFWIVLWRCNKIMCCRLRTDVFFFLVCLDFPKTSIPSKRRKHVYTISVWRVHDLSNNFNEHLSPQRRTKYYGSRWCVYIFRDVGVRD